MKQHFPTIRVIPLFALLVIGWAVPAVSAAAPYVVDPLEELRQVLRTPIRDVGNRQELLWRQEQLKARAKALNVGDLRRALLLQEWRYEDREEAIAAVDKPVRDSILLRLVTVLRQAFQGHRESAKLAAIAQVGEMGVAVSGSVGRTSLAALLGPDLAKLMVDPSQAVRQAAARAIGRINPDPAVASAALGRLLASADPEDRLAASEGLFILLRTTAQVLRNTGPNRMIISHEEVARIDRSVIPLAGRAAADAHAAVRQTGVETLQTAAALLTEMVTEVPRLDFPPSDRPASADERADIEAYRRSVEEERNVLLPVARVLADQGPILTRDLNDPVPQIRLLAERALEEMGQGRLKLLRKAASVPVLGEAKEKTEVWPARSGIIRVAAEEAPPPLPLPNRIPRVEGVPDPLREALRAAVPVLAERAVRDPVPQIRLAAVDALETLGPEAAAAVPALARALGDCYVFVRLASARVLGEIGPVDTALTVPILARHLFDPDLDVELAAANTLGIYGPRATAALPILIQAVLTGDPERRLAMIHTLIAIGDPAEVAIPAIVRALGNKDARLRGGAAEVLGQFGVAARGAIPALERALHDPDGEVRKAASDALLTIEE